MNEKLSYYRIRNYVGILGGLLPFLALFTAGIVFPKPSPEWWYSISVTYYQSPMLVGILTTASIFLMCYDGYELIDNVVTTISGVFGLLIVLFPCSAPWKDAFDLVGTFQLPMYVSNIIHCFSAAVFFILLSFNCFFLFTKHDGEMTENKKKRNVIYRICGIGMWIFIVWQGLTVIFNLGRWWTMINEIFLLEFFAFSWITKGGLIFKD